MNTKIIVDLNDITPEWVADLQDNYKDAKLEINIIPSSGVEKMSEEQFWHIISLLDWQNENDNLILAPAVQKLSDFNIEDIFRFQDILAEKLYQLDRQAFAEQIGDRRYGGSQHFSVDIFLYARACVVANGKAFFEEVLLNPSKMPKSYTFEALLSLAPEAYKRKTNSPWTYLPQKSYETYSNRDGWGGKSWVDSILNT